MLRLPQKSRRAITPQEVPSFIGEDGGVLVIVEPLDQAPGNFFSLDGHVLTLYGEHKAPLPQRFMLGPHALASLKYYDRLTVAEIDAIGPVRTTANLAAFPATGGAVGHS